VTAASSSESRIAVISSGCDEIARQASRVRGALMPVPRVLNSSSAAIGTRKNAPTTTSTVTRYAARSRR